MATIHILDQETINKIAAGEVIERPFSVVKELVENALDAGADVIAIEIKEGGKALIAVADNGSGMPREDARLATLPHATSKLADLFAITTLGFRGEALASIAAVSHLTLATNDGSGGVMLEFDAGKVIRETEIGIPKGTTVTVTDLFFNTPARRNYLKAAAVELSHITDLVTRFALSRPDVSFKLLSNGSPVLVSPKSRNLLNTIVALYGSETAKNMIQVDYRDEFVAITGFVGKPYLAKADRGMQSLFINGRYVKSETISRAIDEAYRTMLFLNRHAVAVLHFAIDASKVDVNVHPTKDIVRIERDDELYRAVVAALRGSFARNGLIPEVAIDGDSHGTPQHAYGISADRQSVLDAAPRHASSMASPAPEAPTVTKHIGPVIVIGQLNKMYILAESAEGLLIIDQHALQERILFERFWRQYRTKSIEQQALLRPLVIELPVSDKGFFLENAGQFEKLGFAIEDYGGNSVRVKAVPKLFHTLTRQEITSLVADLRNYGPLSDDERDERLAVMACRAAVKAGESLTAVKLRQLIEELDTAENPFACPHGRPTMVTISLAELEKKFKRRA